ncbi:hypothetical protein AGR6A_Cc80390 [Agrobacterium sp. NCPPB 925]|nr:hypothetical protein AGR6A_Cc80390 [Agrobacterium sp. NCPPB 925]
MVLVRFKKFIFNSFILKLIHPAFKIRTGYQREYLTDEVVFSTETSPDVELQPCIRRWRRVMTDEILSRTPHRARAKSFRFPITCTKRKFYACSNICGDYAGLGQFPRLKTRAQ